MTKGKEKTISGKKKGELIFYICMIALPLTQICIFFIGVNFNSILLAFKSYTPDGGYIFTGFSNFQLFFKEFFGERSTAMRMMFSNSMWLYFVGLIVGAPLNVVFAYLIYKKIPGSTFFNVILFLPQILSSIVMSIMFRYFMEKGIPAFAQMIGIKTLPSFFVDISATFPTIIAYNIRSSTSAGKDEQRTIEVEEQQPVPLTEEQNTLIQREELTYSDFRKAYLDIQGKLFGMAERYITALDWTEVAVKVETDEELRREKDIFYLVKTYNRKYVQKW